MAAVRKPPALKPQRGAAPILLGPSGECLPIDGIEVAPHRTRDIRKSHVRALAESISGIGLIHPPAVDRHNRLLAGAHRVAALQWLQEHDPARFHELFPNGVPVRRMELNADSNTDLALAVEISENEQRRDYSPAEILRLADRLKAAGFQYSPSGGRPRGEARALMPALEVIVGKSVRQLRRVLNPAAPRKTRTHDLVSGLQGFLATSEELVRRLASETARPELFTLKAQLERVNRLSEAALAVLKNP